MTTKTDIQIRFADVDMLGHVNNVNLQHYFDLGKNDFFDRTIGGNIDWRHEGLILASTATDYMAQTRPKDKIYVETSVEKIGTKSVTLHQRIVEHTTGEVRAESRSVLVAFDFSTQHSIEFPEAWKDKLGV